MKPDAILRFLKTAASRLALTYLMIIMLMSIGFSIVFYNTSAQQLDRQLPPESLYDTAFDGVNIRHDVDQFLRDRIDEGRQALLWRLVLLNIFALIGGGAVSYYLARLTLRPIEDSMEAQSQFVSDAAHELRTPLTAIQASNEVALRKPKLSIPYAKRLIEQNTEDVIRLKQLSDGLLQLASKDTNISELVPVSLQDAASDAMNMVIGLAHTKKISVTDEVPDIKVLAEKQSLVQAIVALIDNAIKYSQPKEIITLGGSIKGKFAYLTVQDNGVGIRAADLPHIFRRFYRSDRARSQKEGYGLGLSIAEALIKRQHGEISATSSLGKGSVFIIKIPLA